MNKVYPSLTIWAPGASPFFAGSSGKFAAAMEATWVPWLEHMLTNWNARLEIMKSQNEWAEKMDQIKRFFSVKN